MQHNLGVMTEERGSPGSDVAAFRALLSMTQASLAVRLGVSRAHLAKVETGKAPLAFRLVDRIIEQFGLPSKERGEDETPEERLNGAVQAAQEDGGGFGGAPVSQVSVHVSSEDPDEGGIDGIVGVLRMISGVFGDRVGNKVELTVHGSVAGADPREEGGKLREKLIFGLGKIPGVELDFDAGGEVISVSCGGESESWITIEVGTADKVPHIRFKAMMR
jgi:DNA-binding XRE family transcriptional regulator